MNPEIDAKQMVKRLQSTGYGDFRDDQLRTLQRRVRGWRSGIARELVFGRESATDAQVMSLRKKQQWRWQRANPMAAIVSDSSALRSSCRKKRGGGLTQRRAIRNDEYLLCNQNWLRQLPSDSDVTGEL
jgi:hypothetical protein